MPLRLPLYLLQNVAASRKVGPAPAEDEVLLDTSNNAVDDDDDDDENFEDAVADVEPATGEPATTSQVDNAADAVPVAAAAVDDSEAVTIATTGPSYVPSSETESIEVESSTTTPEYVLQTIVSGDNMLLAHLCVILADFWVDHIWACSNHAVQPILSIPGSRISSPRCKIVL